MTGDLCPVCHDLIARTGAEFCDGCQLEIDLLAQLRREEVKRLSEQHEADVIAQEERTAA